MKIKVGSDFSGVGAFDQALQRLNIDYETIFACDMDKYARQVYGLVYGEPKYYPDNVYNRNIPKEPLDIYMTSPPCQSFSLSGKRLGKEDVRGVLFFNSLEFIRENKPRYFIFENVKGLLSHDKTNKKAKYGKTFSEWINFLGGKSINGNATMMPFEDSVPYHIYFQVLNAKEHGVPQNRERIFIVGIRDDTDNNFRFPAKEVLKLRLKDVLEPIVDEKYFLSGEAITRLTNNNSGYHSEVNTDLDCASTICASDYKIARGMNMIDHYKIGATDPYIIENANGYVENTSEPTIVAMRGRYNDNGVIEQNIELNGNITSNAITTVQKDNLVIIPTNNSKGFDILTENDSLNISNPNSKTRRGRIGKGVAQTLDTACNQCVLVNSEPAPLVEYQLTGGKRDKTHEQSGRVYDKNGIAPTIHTMQGGNQQPKIIDEPNSIVSYGNKKLTDIINKGQITDLPTIIDTYNESLNTEIIPTITTGIDYMNCTFLSNKKRIRKLTPTEVFRLMNFDESFMDKIKAHNEANPKQTISDSQLYRQGGNSIVVACLEKIIKNLKFEDEK